MVFSSLVFIFGFLTVHLIVYMLVSQRWKNWVLLISSLIFYAWGGPQYVLLLMGETLASWLFAQLIESSESPTVKKLGVAGECIVLLGLLGYFKYATFFASNWQAIFGVPEAIPNIVLPIGISFYTFQLISYVCDVYSGKVKAQKNYWKLLLYSSLFHQCIAGPIVRYETVVGDIEHRKVTKGDIEYGVRRFCVGLAKKAVLANGCANVADKLLPIGDPSIYTQVASGYWLGMAFYMLQIYLDFSAYSDMAIGMGRMVGFHYLENFNYPYEATSIRDFWRRWHISLSSFFRDYVYIPLGGSRCSNIKIVRNLFIVWFLTGMWHGASWNYILWGLYFCAFLVLERFVIKDRLSKVPSHIYAIVVVYFGWVIFKFENFAELGAVFAGMFGLNGAGFFSGGVATVFTENIFLLIFGIIACTSLGKRLRKALQVRSRKSEAALNAFAVLEMITPPLLLLISVIVLAGNSYNPFIYFRF